MSNKFLVIGGTGMLGLPVAKQLTTDGFDVIIMSSNTERAKERLGDQFDWVQGDVTQPESLKKVISESDFIYISLSAKIELDLYQKIEIEGIANVARIASESGIKRIGMISGASSEGKEKGIIYLDAKVKAERSLIESGIPYTIFRPSWFFETLPHFIQSGRATVLGKQPIPRSWLAAKDYAQQVSRAYQSDDAANKCFYNLGPQQMITIDALKKYCDKFHPELNPDSISFMKAKMVSMMPRMEMLKKAIPFFQYFETQPEPSDAPETDRLLGPNLTTLEEWLLENKG